MKTNARIFMLGVITACLSILGVARAQTVLWSETFADGNGNNRWYADTGVWQIGSPTIGPETNSAGSRTYPPISTNCATTGLTANYPSGMNSRLIRIQTFAVPDAIQFPRLCFWHWYDFASESGVGNDYGVVEVRVGTTGAWQAVSPQYTGFSGDWTYESLDLGAFAGQTVDVAFHVVGPTGGDPGWYVDDIAFETGTPVFNNPEGFEGGIGNWYAEQGTWQVGKPNKSSGAPTNSLGVQAYSGTNCAVTLLNANYPSRINSRLISPLFILPPASLSPYLRFWHWYDFASESGVGNDYGVVEIRVGTNAWQAVSPQYTGTAGAYWTEPFVDLTSYGGQTVQLAFQIVAVAPAGNNPGWYVDNVQIYPYTLSAANPYMIINPSGTNAIVTWTSLPDYSGFTLQSSTNLDSPTNWYTASPTPVVVNGQNTETNPASGTQQYYRLVQ
jgi:hypothetical protein